MRGQELLEELLEELLMCFWKNGSMCNRRTRKSSHFYLIRLFFMSEGHLGRWSKKCDLQNFLFMMDLT